MVKKELLLLHMANLHERTEQVFVLGRFFEATVSRSQSLALYEYTVIASINKTSVVRNIVEQLNIGMALLIVARKRFGQMNIGAC